ncbi:DUF4390 domain-containing protein [Thioalkalivibrio sp.]|uniref:DUF4390 domain-containing protein n=1 Tax=Thioalkalivibrio sp. TaxID=2093813 RepID=UPI003975FEF3
MRIWLCGLLALLLLPSATMAAEIRHADHIWQDENHLLVRLYLDMSLPDVLVEALANGVVVNFRSEVRLGYARGILGERTLTAADKGVRLEYYALSRHYVVTDLELERMDLAPTLGDALEMLARRLGRVVLEMDPDALRPGLEYTLATRVQLDHSALPLPLQWDARLRGAYGTQLGWHRWSLQ